VGNYLLLAQPFNSSLGNLEWPAKKQKIEAVKASQTPLTVAALRFSVWNKPTINARSTELAKKAATHWSSARPTAPTGASGAAGLLAVRNLAAPLLGWPLA
jgi:hypothetical protein